MRQHNLYLFVVISLTNILLYLLSSYVLNLDKMFIHSLSEQLTSEQIQKILSIREKWQWVQYALVPLFIGVRVAIVSLLLDVGCLFFNEEIPWYKAVKKASVYSFVQEYSV